MAGGPWRAGGVRINELSLNLPDAFGNPREEAPKRPLSYTRG